MSRKGLLFAFIILAFLGAAININAGWLYFLDSALIAFVVVAFLTHFVAVRNLKLDILISSTHVDTGSDIVFTLYADREIAPYKLIFHIDKQKHTLLPELNSRGLYEYRLNIPSRGKYDIIAPVIELFDSTGLIILKKKLALKDSIYVYPKLSEYNETIQPMVYQGMIREGRVNATGNGIMFSYIREYNKGDTIRTINWRDYAKTGLLSTKLMENEVGSQTLVACITATQEDNISKGLSVVQGIVGTGIIHRVMFLVDDAQVLLAVGTPEWYEYLATVRPQSGLHALADVYIEDSGEVVRVG